MENLLQTLPDSLYERVRREDLLQDEVYVKLARDGWYSQEIVRIMDNYLQYRKSKVKGSHSYGMYAKQWLPSYGYAPGGDSIYQLVDTAYSQHAIAGVRRLYAATLDDYYPQIPYTPDDRLSGKRNTGYFRPVLQHPNTGRIHWIVADPLNADHIMVVPDGAGIFRTSDMGRTWDCVTDRIPDREFRKICYHSAIPVDPDNWDHFFAFMKNGGTTRVYETTDGGQTWTCVEGATHKNFKRGYGFKDAAGNFKFIGACQSGNYLYNTLWTSEDKGKTWNQITLPDDLKETHPENTNKGAFFQNFAFHPENRNLIFLPASRSIYYFDDGVTPTVENGQKVYHIKKMKFDVLSQDGTTVRAQGVTEFPFKATTQGFLEIDPAHPDTMWFASASRNVSYGVYSAVYKTMDGGKTWLTLQEPLAGIGSGLAFGNESPWGWLGGFGVNFKNPQYLYGCSMSSAISTDGGKNFWEYAWGNRLKAEYNGGFYYTTSSRHNADNHCIVSHPSGRVFRGSDSGVLMIDENINGHQWTNINGPMGNQLHYSIKVNEFGDQVMLGNTQDVDVQTYKYGRWENWRGYEGTEAFINPYGGTCYFSGGGGGLDGIDFGSWREGYPKADVCTGNWYMIHNQDGGSFYRVEDFGRTPVNITSNTADNTGAGAGANDFALSRGKDGTPVLYVYNKNNTVVRSVDNGNTFQTLQVQVGSGLVNAKYANCKLAVDPNNDIVYLGQKGGKVFKINVETHAVEELTAGLPASITCKSLIFHEGSGDLYYCGDVGIYLLEHGTDTWRLWMTGYNPLFYGNAVLNYTTQELVLSDYGRGIWVADLEHPSDRYFSEGFDLKEISEVDGRTTVGIDTKWTIPMYYEYSWTVNGVEQMVPYQYLTARLNPGDKVQLKLTLRESPDVSTTSAVYVVPDKSKRKNVELPVYDPKPGKALYSDGNGRIDLGYVDYFYNDFTIDFWVNAESDGVILCNRPVEIERDTRGWALMLENGQLKFRFAPANMVYQPSYEQGFTQQRDVVIGSFAKGQWNHVALSQDRDGNVVMYLNGKTTAQAARLLPAYTLNSSLYLSLFADGYERKCIKAAVDELRIWKSALSADEVRKVMYSHDAGRPDDLLYYQDFNAGQLDAERELFSRQGMRVRTRAVTRYVDMPVKTGARWADLRQATSEVTFASGDKQLLKVKIDQPEALGQVGAYEYNLQGATSLPGVDSQYYEVVSDLYQFRTFGTDNPEAHADLYFPQSWDASQRYTLYVSDRDALSTIWNKLAVLERDEATGQFVARGVSLADLQGRQFVVLRNKAAVEVSVQGGSLDNTLVIYDKNETKFVLKAEAVAGMQEPTGTYQVHSEKGYLLVQDAFNFQNGKAEGTVSVDMRKIGNAREVTDRLIGQDGRMVPVTVKIQNQVMPEEIGHSTVISTGGMIFENAKLIEKLNGTKQMTFMAWVRIDDPTFMSGVKPLIFTRTSSPKVCGMNLSAGNLGFHWNDGYYGWKSNLTLSADDAGRWVHLAMAVAPDGVRLYMNGMEYVHSFSVTPAQIGSDLMLGADSRSDRRFSGAFDQVSVWGRTLSADEIRQYMYHAPRLDAASLLAYADMDSLSSENAVVDRVSGLPLTPMGTVHQEANVGALYNPSRELVQETGDTESGQTFFLEQPSGKKTRCVFAIFNGVGYNSVSTGHPELFPLVNRHYALTFAKLPGFTSSETLRLTVNSAEQISTDDRLTLALRPFGRQTEYSSFIPATSVEEGKAVFEIPGNLVNGSVDFMLMTDVQVQNKPVKVDLKVFDRSGTHQIQEGDVLVLKEGEEQFLVRTDVVSDNNNAQVVLSSVEKNYVDVQKTLNLKEKPSEEFLVTIDKSALDPFAENPVTLRLSGVTENTDIHFKVSLEPIVKLTLLQDQKALDNESVITVDNVNCNFHVQVDLLQGVLKENLPFVTEYDSTSLLKVNTGTQVGNLLANYAVTMKNTLEYHSAAEPEDEGWNLVGNPYLHNLNLTKKQNIDFDEAYLQKYMYQYDPETDTYRAWDMVDNYDPDQQLKSLQPFFVQTCQEGASLTITPEAKNQNISRRVFDHYNLSDAAFLRLSLLSENQQEYDCTQIRIQDDADDDYLFGEDAVKMWGGLNAQSNEIATQASGRRLSVNVVASHQIEIPLYLKLSHTGTFELALTQQNGFVFTDKIQLYDKKLKVRHDLQTGRNYRFQVDAVAEATTRFALLLSTGDETTGIDSAEDQEQKIQIGANGMCTVSGLSGKNVIEVFDVIGRRILYMPTSENTLNLRLKSGTYVVNVRGEQSDYSQKIVVK